MQVARSLEIMKAFKGLEIQSAVTCVMEGREPWLPKVKVINGKQLICISKWDRGFTKFYSGHSLDLRKDKGRSLNQSSMGAYLDHLCQLRREASTEAAYAKMFGDSDEKPAKRRRMRVTNNDAAFCPLVTVKLPEVSFEDVELESKQVSMAFATSGSELWVEADTSIMYHICAGAMLFEACGGRCKKKT